MRIALDQDMRRVQRLFLATPPCCYDETLRREHESASGAGLSDQNLPGFVIRTPSGEAVGPIRDGASVILFNFRGDRAIEITRVFEDETFTKFFQANLQSSVWLAQMTLPGMPCSRSFVATRLTLSLPKMASSHGAKATGGGMRGRPKTLVARAIATAGAGPSKTCITAGMSICTRATEVSSEHSAKTERRGESTTKT